MNVTVYVNVTSTNATTNATTTTQRNNGTYVTYVYTVQSVPIYVNTSYNQSVPHIVPVGWYVANQTVVTPTIVFNATSGLNTTVNVTSTQQVNVTVYAQGNYTVSRNISTGMYCANQYYVNGSVFVPTNATYVSYAYSLQNETFPTYQPTYQQVQSGTYLTLTSAANVYATYNPVTLGYGFYLFKLIVPAFDAGKQLDLLNLQRLLQLFRRR